MNELPNILWYVADQQRYDTLGVTGNPHVRTPNLDQFAAKGVAFTQAYVQNQVCTPSRTSMLTGRYPASHRVYRNGIAHFPASEVLVSRLLADAGYDCGLIGKLHLSTAMKTKEVRPDDGFRHFQWSHNPYPGEMSAHNAYHHWLAAEHGLAAEKLFQNQDGFCGEGVPAALHQSTWCTDQAIRFIKEERSKPWFLSVNPYDPHPPFDPPAEYFKHFDLQSLPPPLFREADLERQKAFRNIRQQAIEAINPLGQDPTEAEEHYEDQSARGSRPPRQFDGRRVKAAYYAMIELLDDQFGRLLDSLAQCGELENTLVIYCSDHGELLGDHGLLYKGCRFFEGLVHVPLIIGWGEQLQSGRLCDALVESVDIAPTLLEAAGLAVPYFMQGRSLLPLLRGQADPAAHKEVVITDFNDSVGYSPANTATQATMTFDGRYKLAIYHRENLGELFDLQEDPGEFVNLWEDKAHQELKQRLVMRHLDALMGTVAPGIHRVATA